MPWAPIVVLTCLAVGPSPKVEDSGRNAEEVFARQVWPVLEGRCLPCHGGGPNREVKGGLDLSGREGALRGGQSGEPALVPGDSAASGIVRAVGRSDDFFSAMPPKENDRLSDSEMEAIRGWIDAGAAWPSAERLAELVRAVRDEAGVRVKTSGGLSPGWTDRTYREEDLWCYQPVRRPEVPAIPGAASAIDAFLTVRLRELGLEAAPPAERGVLIRRATFDLTGLPPTPEEVDAFESDPDPDDRAWARVVDRLLASPHYGERMAQHWLDVARYADSSGLANDYERGNAWRYRDYVVRSFNRDKPYNAFVREQIAGDELDPSDSEMLVATGFLRMGPWELTGMEVPRVARQRFLDDVTDAVGQVFLGQMLQCARCHDHKFDPIPTRDYYRIQAVFGTTQVAERAAPFLPDEVTLGFDEERYLAKRRAAFEADLARIKKGEEEALARWRAEAPGREGQRPPRHELLSATELGLERIGRKGLERLAWEADRYEPFALSVYSGRTPALKAIYRPLRMPENPEAGELERTAILSGGDPFSPADEVSPGVLSAAGDTSLPESVFGRRLALAEWIVEPGNPLTARVMANRIWQWTMGQALAGNPNNFGATGKKPSHPELLDWLAVEFVEGGWSVKGLQRLILMSEAYRRSAQPCDPEGLKEKDPEGTSYASFRARRLTGEELRDAMLKASGELNPAIGGIPVRPEIQDDVALQPRQVMGTFAPAWEASPLPSQRNRRTIYALKLRGLRDPLLEVFNAPGLDTSCEGREVSTVAPQALTLLNGQAARSRALALAWRVSRETASTPEAMERAFRLCLGRGPTEAELDKCVRHAEAMAARHRLLAWEEPRRRTEVTREAIDENTGEPFRYTESLVSAADFVADLHPSRVSAEVRGLMEVCLVLFNTNEFIYVE